MSVELTTALRARDVERINALLAAGTAPTTEHLALAASDRDLALLDLLLRHGAPTGAEPGRDGALHRARDARCVQRLVAAGADVNHRGLGGQTPLHLAAANADPPVVKALLQAGADPAAVNDRGQTPLEGAAELGRTAAVKALLAHPPADPLAWRLLATFAQRSGKKDLATLEALLTVVPADAPPLEGFGYALHLAARAGIPAAVEALLAAGADKNRLDFEGFTAAHRAVATALQGFDPRPGNEAAYAVLAQAGADLDVVCGGTTARTLATRLRTGKR